jgi:hypothetical protein
MDMPIRRQVRSGLLAVLLGLTLLPPAHAIWGLLGKLGAGAGKAAGTVGKGAAGVAGKGAATGGAAVAGAELAAVEGAQAAKAGVLATQSADDLARATGLGKAVPDEIAAMAYTPGRTLADVPDLGVHSWLSTPIKQLNRADADLMVSDYVRLLEGKAAQGRPATLAAKSATPAAATKAPKLPTTKPAAQVPWHAVELLVRAAHLGHKGAQTELSRLCSSTGTPMSTSAECQRRAATRVTVQVQGEKR